MATGWDALGGVDPKTLVEARLLAHRAVQWVTRAARANLAAKPDDSHSNLGWDRSLAALVSHPLAGGAGNSYRAGLRLEGLTLFLAEGARPLDSIALDGRGDADAAAWIDAALGKVGLKAASGMALPYAIGAHPVASGAPYGGGAARPALAELARWYDTADAILEETRAHLAAGGGRPSPVRCWPHHFDIATLLALGAGDAESAASIGIGMSPGDESYPLPYYYIGPWPAPSPAAWPELPVPGHWHRQGFTAAVATADAVLALSERGTAMRRFLDGAIEASRRLLEA